MVDVSVSRSSWSSFISKLRLSLCANSCKNRALVQRYRQCLVHFRTLHYLTSGCNLSYVSWCRQSSLSRSVQEYYTIIAQDLQNCALMQLHPPMPFLTQAHLPQATHGSKELCPIAVKSSVHCLIQWLCKKTDTELNPNAKNRHCLSQFRGIVLQSWPKGIPGLRHL
jgi:hypothetical protein